MYSSPPAKSVAYRKVSAIAIVLTIYQISILYFDVFSRSLLADTVHGVTDLAPLLGTTYLLARMWGSEAIFLKKRRFWLFIGVWSLALGGLLVAGESAYDLLNGATGTLRSPQLLFAAILGAGGNWWMHRILHNVTHKDKDSLDKLNLSHVFWDGILSLAVIVAFLTGSPIVDRVLAIIVGAIVLPLLACMRWKDDGHDHKHADGHATHDECAHHHD